MTKITITANFEHNHAWESYVATWEDLSDFSKVGVWDANGCDGNYFDCNVEGYLNRTLREKIVKKVKKIKLLDVLKELDGGYITLYDRRIAGGYTMTINVNFDEELED